MKVKWQDVGKRTYYEHRVNLRKSGYFQLYCYFYWHHYVYSYYKICI